MNSMTLNPAGEMGILPAEGKLYDSELNVCELERYQGAPGLVRTKDGKSALSLFFRSSSDSTPPVEHGAGLVLLHVKLPGIEGQEALRRLKRAPGTQRIPVAVLRSSPYKAEVERSYQPGTNTYAVKPVDFGTFVEAVGQSDRYRLRMNQMLEECCLR